MDCGYSQGVAGYEVGYGWTHWFVCKQNEAWDVQAAISLTHRKMTVSRKQIHILEVTDGTVCTVYNI